MPKRDQAAVITFAGQGGMRIEVFPRSMKRPVPQGTKLVGNNFVAGVVRMKAVDRDQSQCTRVCLAIASVECLMDVRNGNARRRRCAMNVIVHLVKIGLESIEGARFHIGSDIRVVDVHRANDGIAGAA